LKKILFIVSHRLERAPNQRFRFEQYLPYLEKQGFKCVVSPLIVSEKEDRLFYGSGNAFKKIPLGIKLASRRIKDVLRAKEFDVIFIAREAFVTGSSFFEGLLRNRHSKIIFDFDDAIWLNVISTNNRYFSWLKDANKTKKIIALSDLIFAGNEYLADYARKFNAQVVLVPTTIDTSLYAPHYKTNKQVITIGWSGSTSTIEHFQHAIPALTILKEKYKEQIEIKVIGDSRFKHEPLGIKGLAWNFETEVLDLQSIDIGIMPLPDNEWTWGKCGLKGLQYMALEIPTVMSPVGVNKEIIQDGKNGFLADTTEDWATKISMLIESEALRLSIGKEGRKTVVSHYSIESQKTAYIKEFISICGNS
jgi:glycosyltransferase involved in cell wall biosynthesis